MIKFCWSSIELSFSLSMNLNRNYMKISLLTYTELEIKGSQNINSGIYRARNVAHQAFEMNKNSADLTTLDKIRVGREALIFVFFIVRWYS